MHNMESYGSSRKKFTDEVGIHYPLRVLNRVTLGVPIGPDIAEVIDLWADQIMPGLR